MPAHANGSFAQDLLRTANRLRSESGLAPTAEVGAAAAFVLRCAVSGAMRSVHACGADGSESADAVAGVAFTCFAASPILLSLREEGHELGAFDVIAEAGLAMYRGQPREETVEILHAGIQTFNDVVAAARDHRNIREWNDHISKVMLIYVMTGREECLPILGRLYLALHQARLA